MNLIKEGHHFGTPRARLDTGGLMVRLSDYAPCQDHPEHAHETGGFFFVLGGRFGVSYGHNETVFEPFTMAYHPGRQTHSSRSAPEGARLLTIEFGMTWLESLGAQMVSLPRDLRPDSSLTTLLGLRMLRATLDRDDAGLNDVALELLTLTVEDPRPIRSTPPWLRQARELLDAGFRLGAGLSSVAHEVAVHPIYLARVFRRRYGCSVTEYVLRKRVEYAARQIGSGGASLSKIGIEAGFSDHAHFTRSFRKLTGLTPSVLKAQLWQSLN